WPLTQGGSDKNIQSFLKKDYRMWAGKNAKPSGADLPVIMLMHGSAADFAFLGEYLASHGYLCINVPTKGYLQSDLDINRIGVETQVRDYEFAISEVRKKFSINSEELIAVGFSFGGQSAVGYAMRNPHAKAVISLDGGIGTRFGARMIQESVHYAPENINLPILHIYNIEDQANHLEPLKSYAFSERSLIGIKDIKHWHFTSFGKLSNEIANLFGEFKSNQAFEVIAYTTKSFVDHIVYLKPEPSKDKDWIRELVGKREYYPSIGKDK
ncbi:MAG: dienelactone hydrolase family protein, partial [Pseudomonadota bacterium]|nr:dienelactone hydrolase family protein [Pseudomonadota bacterium]